MPLVLFDVCKYNRGIQHSSGHMICPNDLLNAVRMHGKYQRHWQSRNKQMFGYDMCDSHGLASHLANHTLK